MGPAEVGRPQLQHRGRPGRRGATGDGRKFEPGKQGERGGALWDAEADGEHKEEEIRGEEAVRSRGNGRRQRR